MQAKLHRWAVAEADRRFDDLFNLVHDPAPLIVAWDRVATNRGANTAGSDGWTITRIEREVGSTAFLATSAPWSRAGSSDVRRWLTDHTGRWKPISGNGIELFNPETIPIRRYRYRGNQIPHPWAQAA